MTNSAKTGTRKRRWPFVLAFVVLVYLALAYVLVPTLWIHHEHEAGLASLPMLTRTSDDIPGDPLNVGLVGEGGDVVRAMNAAGWSAADAVTLRSSIEIVGSVVLDRPYRDPVGRSKSPGYGHLKLPHLMIAVSAAEQQ
ncbi:LssY C-terminal domain-containing protein [Bradyrhizobium sp. USDA 241]|uniref:LssY C-terminal domain-containing protein n=1 Tax=Bradyrhizobium sp. USDA 241 TaxID=3377725 RepID=UPI003C74AFD1